MGIYTRYTTAVLTLLLAIVTASTAHSATLHPVPGIARALAAGPSGVMPSGLTVQRSQQLGVMLLKSQVQLALGGGAIVPVTRGASLSVGALAKGAVTLIKNGNPGKLIGGAVIGGALSMIPGARVLEGELIRVGEGPPVLSGTNYYHWKGSYAQNTGAYADPISACKALTSMVSANVGGSSRAVYHSISKVSDRTVTCLFQKQRYNSETKTYTDYDSPTGYIGWNIGAIREGSGCPPRTTYSSTQMACVNPEAVTPFGDADYDALEGAIPSSDPSPADVTDFWFNLCGGDGACLGSYTSDPTLSGPASVQGPKTTTTSTGPNGTTTTTKDTQHDIDYSKPDGIVVRDRTTTTTTNPDGSTNTDTTTDTGPVVVAPPAQDNSPDLDGSFSDTPFPEVTPFYEQKYPEGLEGVWSARKAEFEDSAFIDFLHSFVPSFSGSCPAWSLNVNVASWAAFGIHDFQTLCWVFDFVKVVLLVSAAFLCRSLIFGG